MKKLLAFILVLSMVFAVAAVSAVAEEKKVYNVAYLVNGNLGELVKNIRAVSRETCCDGSTVLPYLAAHGVVISGK